MSALGSLPIEEVTKGASALDEFKSFGLDLLKTVTTTAITKGVDVLGDVAEAKLKGKAREVVTIAQASAATNTAEPTPEKANTTNSAGPSSAPSTSSGGKSTVKTILVAGAVVLGLVLAVGATYKFVSPKKAA